MNEHIKLVKVNLIFKMKKIIILKIKIVGLNENYFLLNNWVVNVVIVDTTEIIQH